MPTSLKRLALSLVSLILLSAATAKADPVTLVLSGADFSGPTDNTGGNITVHIQNIVGGVRITLTNNLVLGAFGFGGTNLDQLYLNTSVAPLAGAAGTCVNCTAIGGQTMTFNFGSNAFQADGAGRYDIFITFSSSVTQFLTPGEAIVFDITSSTAGFTSDSFLSLPGPGGSNVSNEAAARIDGLGPDGRATDFITNTPAAVPEPTSMLLLGTGLLGVAGAVRRKLKTRN